MPTEHPLKTVHVECSPHALSSLLWGLLIVPTEQVDARADQEFHNNHSTQVMSASLVLSVFLVLGSQDITGEKGPCSG